MMVRDFRLLYGVLAALALVVLVAVAAFYGGTKHRDLEQKENTNRVLIEREQINDDVEDDDNLLDRALRSIVQQAD